MKFSLSDGVVTVLVGLLSGLLLYFFLTDLNAIASHGKDPALGTIFFKKQTATRKSSDSPMWERLRNQSPVYQADTLRTDQDSEAVVDFEDGLSLDMLQNSMLKLTARGQSTNLDFTGGSITLHGGDKSGMVILGQNGRTVALSADAQLVLTKTSGTTSLELSQGTAQVSDGHGSQQTITPETAMDISESGAASLRPVDLIPRVPEQGARLLSLETGKTPVKFGCEISASAKPGASDIQIQLSGSADFASADSYPGTSGEAEIPLEAGTWYWRVASGAAHSSTRQLTLAREDSLSLIQPQEGSDLFYRKKEPLVHFSWTASEHVAYWDLELIMGDEDFKTPALKRRTTVSSLSLDGLKAGKWSWRVIPHYNGTMLSAGQTQTVGHFTITQRPQMTALVPTLPLEGTLVQTQDLSARGLAFTWEPPAEAQRYELTAYRSQAPGARPVATFESSSPYRIVTPQELGDLAEVGASFWVLRWFDIEGNASPAGVFRGIQAVDGSLALRPTFPPDGYRTADRFVTNTRFSWKSNLPTRTVFQVSNDRDFKEPIFEQQTKADTLLGNGWGIGTYYWRLSSYNADGSVFVQTPPRRFEVVGPLPQVHLVRPNPEETVFLPETKDFTVSWPAVKDADYYRLTLFAASSSGSLSRMSDQANVEKNADAEGNVSATLPSQLSEGSYVARIQAFAREKPASTSVIGLYGDSFFSFRRLVLMKLLSPADGSLIDGLTARRQGVSLIWDTGNLPPDAVVKLTSITEGRDILNLAMTAVVPAKLPRLNAGDYTWTVQGHIDGFDVSAKVSNHFTVLPIPQLPAPLGLEPTQGTVYGPKQLRKMKGIEFAWKPVPQAQEYLFSLYQDTGGQVDADLPVCQLRSAEPRAALERLEILHRGSYWWEVQARTLDASGETEQVGIPARSRFTIELPVLGAPQLPTGQAFYGR
jgi:hypothetical protein